MRTEVEIREWLEELETDPRLKLAIVQKSAVFRDLEVEITCLKWVLEIKEGINGRNSITNQS